MNLNLKNKGVVINIDNTGMYYRIAKRLNTEGADSFIKNKKQDHDHIYNGSIKINALVNIKENHKIEDDSDFLKPFHHANCLADNFTIINIGTKNTLGIKTNAYKNDNINLDKKADLLEQELNIKSINIVYPDTTLIAGIDQSNIPTNEAYYNSVNEQIVDSVAFFIAQKTVLKNGQIIFIDNGLHLLQAASI